MKKVKLLSFVLVLMMVASCFVTGFASTTTSTSTYTEAEILAGTFKDAGYDFTQMTAEEIAACVASNTRLSVTADSGAKLSLNSTTKYDGYVNIKGLEYSSSSTKAIKITFVAPENPATMQVDLRDSGERFRLHTYDNSNNKVDDPTICFSNSSANYSQYVITPGVTYSVIGKKNSSGYYDFYAKTAEETEYTLIKTDAQPISPNEGQSFSSQFTLGVAGDALEQSIVYKDVAVYVEGSSEEEILSGLIEGDGRDFTQMTEEQIAAYGTAGTNAETTKVANGLQLKVKSANGSTDTTAHASIKLGLTYNLQEGEAIKFSFMPSAKASNFVMIDAYGNGERLKVRTNNPNIVYHTTGSAKTDSGYAVDSSKVYDIIVKKNNSLIDIYAKESEKSGYKKIISQQAIFANANYTGSTVAFNFAIEQASVGDSAVLKEVTQYIPGGSREEILSTSNAVLHHYDFDATYDGVADIDATSADGYDFAKNSSTLKLASSSYVPVGGAAVIRFKINNSTFYPYVYCADGKRAVVLITANGSVRLRTVSNNEAYDVGTIEQNTWYTMILKDNGIGIDFYMSKSDTENFALLKSTGEKQASSATQSTMDGSAGTYVDYFTIYGPAVNDMPENTGLKLLHQVDFASDTNIFDDAKVITKRNAVVSNGVLNLTQTTEGDNTVVGGYFYDNSGIPAGGYAEYTIKGSSIIPKFFQGGHYMAVNTVAHGVDGLNPWFRYPATDNTWEPAVNVSHTPNVKWVYRIARSADGNTYSVWRKLDGTEGWTKVFSDITVRGGQTEVKSGFEGVGEVDYVKIYAPVSEGIVMTDGDNTTLFVDGTATLKYPKELRVIANSNQNGVLVLGLYNGNDLGSAMIESVVADTEKVVVKDVSAAKKVKVFCWDSFTQMNRLYEASPEISVVAE